MIDDLDLKEERFLGELAREMRKIREEGGDAIVIATARRVVVKGGKREEEERRRREEEEGRREERLMKRGRGKTEERREDEGLNEFWLRLFDDVFYLNYPSIEEKLSIMDKILEKRGVSLEVNKK